METLNDWSMTFKKVEHATAIINNINELIKDNDYYNYMDNIDVEKEATDKLIADLMTDNLYDIVKLLDEIISDDNTDDIIFKAKNIKYEILRFNHLYGDDNLLSSIKEIHATYKNFHIDDVNHTNKRGFIFKHPISLEQYHDVCNKHRLSENNDLVWKFENIQMLEEAGLFGVILSFDGTVLSDNGSNAIGILGVAHEQQYLEIEKSLNDIVNRKILRKIEGAFSDVYFIEKEDRNILEINPSESIENFESLNNEQRLLWLKQVYGIDEITNTVYLDNMTIYDYDNSNQVIENFKSSILDDIYNLGLEDFYLSREDCYHIGLGEDYDQELDDEQEYLEHCHEQDEVDDELEL